jgi:RNA polymerase sigma-70 factor (ECF subfamily)
MTDDQASPPTAPLDRCGQQRGHQQATPLSLLDRVRACETGAWGRLIKLYQPLVRSWCSRAGLHGPDAEDIGQEVFAAAAAGLESFHRDRPGDTFRGWLRGITRNHILLHFRRNGRHPQSEGGSDAWQALQEVADPLPGPGDDETEELGQLFQRALEQVRPAFEERTWQAFWLTTVVGRAPATLTEELGMSVASIRQAKCRVLRRLKQEMGELLS